MKHALVTGSAGFIGFHLTKKLLSMGYRVTGIDNLNAYYDPGLKLKRLGECGIRPENDQVVQSRKYDDYRFLQADMAGKDRLISLFRNNRFDVVIHLAAQPGARTSVTNPDDYISNNIIAFYNLLEACRDHPPQHLLYASSSSIYGSNKEMPYREDQMTDSPASLYGATKKSNELMAYAYSQLYGIPMTGLRFFTVYGPWGRPDMVYFLYTKAILEGDPIKVYNEGNMKRDFTYVDDIIEGIVDLLDVIPGEEVPHCIFNIGNAVPVNLLDFIQTLESLLKKKAEKILLPLQKGDVLATYSDTSKLEKYCGYKPDTKLEDGLRNFVRWYLEEYQNHQ